MANRSPLSQSALSQWHEVREAFEGILRHDGYLVPLLAPLTLVPMVSAWAVNAVFNPAGPWWEVYAAWFARHALLSTVTGLLLAAFAACMVVTATMAGLGRRNVLRWLGIAISAATSLGYQVAITDYGISRKEGVARIVRKGETLVDAIDRFRAQYGRIPARLSELEGRFVAESRLGMAGYPDFDYTNSFGRETYTLVVPLHTWPERPTQIVYRSAPPPNATDPSLRYGVWCLEHDPKR